MSCYRGGTQVHQTVVRGLLNVTHQSVTDNAER